MGKSNTVTIHYSRIRILSIILLAIPTVLFFALWLKPVVSIPAIILLGIAVFLSSRTEDKTLSIKFSSLIILGIIIFIWLYIAGQGGFFTQKQDHEFRNAILRDMINYKWPVRYNNSNNESLVYYIGYWIVPSLVGKVFATGGFEIGYLAARITLFIWSFVLIYLSAILICFKLNQNTLKGLLIIMAVFVFFSGMDAVGGIASEDFTYHIEWWAVGYQYSSMGTQLCWVYNQALPAWLSCSLAINEKDERSYALIGLLLLSTSPLPLVGLACYMLYKAVKNIVMSCKEKKLKERLKIIISIPNVLSVVVLFPIYWFFYDNNVATDASADVSVAPHFIGASQTILLVMYVLFVLLEFGILLLLIVNRKNRSDAIFVGIMLMVIPFIHVGWSIDFCMRASIPGLFFLMVMLMEFFVTNMNNKDERNKLILVGIIFVIGAVTPMVEYTSSIRDFVQTNGRSASRYDYLTGLSDIDLQYKENFVGVDSDNTFFYRHLAR